MNKAGKQIDTVRASRAGHTFHERWSARRALQLVFPKDNLFAIVVEGLSPNESLQLGQEAEDIADLILFYGDGDTFGTCSAQQILQFKYKVAVDPVTSSYLKKTIKKFAATLRQYEENTPKEEVEKKLSFGFVTNAEFSPDLWDAISCLKSGVEPKTDEAKTQLKYLQTWCKEEKIEASHLFPLIEFRAATSDLPTQNRCLRRTVSDWSADSDGRAKMRLFALVELVREKAQVEGQNNNSIRREDVLDALECDEDHLFPADTRFIDVGDVVERSALNDVKGMIVKTDVPVFLYADGGVGKTVFIQSLAAHLSDTFEAVVFDCFGGGAYRSEAQARHLPCVGLLQIVNELASRGLCDPLLPTDADQYGLIAVARKRLQQASKTVKEQSSLQGIMLVIDAADNAQLEADHRNEQSFPRLLLSSLSAEPIDGVKLILTARPHRMDSVIGRSKVERVELQPFSQEETRRFIDTRRENVSDVEFSTAFARSRGNARVLEYLVESWDENILGDGPKTEITAEELIAQKCEKIFGNLHTAGWLESEVREFFAALSLLPPPIPLDELAPALGWSNSQVNSAASDLAPMLEIVKHGAIFRDEPTETYINDRYANEVAAQQSIAQRLQDRQNASLYAAEALPHFLVVIGDSNRAYQLAKSEEYPVAIGSDYGRRRLKLARLHAAFALSTRDQDLDRVLTLAMQLSQVASANARGDQFIRHSPAFATILGDNDATRRLFNDRSGWRGARDARLAVAYSFSEDLDDARIHQNRAIGWINWYLGNDDEKKRFNNAGFGASDVAAVIFINLLKNDLRSLNRNIQLWTPRFGLSVVGELISLCTQHEASNGSQALQNLVRFAASRRCLSLVLQIGLLSNECGLKDVQLKAVARAASTLSAKYKKNFPEDGSDYEFVVQGEVASAAITSIIVNSKQSAKRILSLYSHRRPSDYDYGERHGTDRVWIPALSSCLSAWASGVPLTYHHLMPQGIKIGRKERSIDNQSALNSYLDSLEVISAQRGGKKDGTQKKRKRFPQHEREEIVESIECILRLAKPIEIAILSGAPVSNATINEFLTVWKSELRSDTHWRSERGRDNVARRVGIGFIKVLLRASLSVEKTEAELLIEIISGNRFTLSDKLGVLALISRRLSLNDVAGKYAKTLSAEIRQDEYIEQRGEYYRELAGSLIPMSLAEAREYYKLGLAQLDQMGGDDFDLIYSTLRYAAEQSGGCVKPELSHRLMNLCQTIFQHEPSKFGWTLFGQAAASSIGYPAVYKLVRWDDQDVADFSYGLPQLACYLAKAERLNPRRAAVLLTICEDHGWHEWQVGKGLVDLLSVAKPDSRQAIFSLVVEKLNSEHTFGAWETLWESLLDCVKTFEEINDTGLRERLEGLRDTARRKRDLDNARLNYEGNTTGKNLQLGKKSRDDQDGEKAFNAIVAKLDTANVLFLDEALQEIELSDVLQFSHRQRLFENILENCPYDKRAAFVNAICESTELEFDRALDLIIECVEAWADSTAHVKENIREIISKLFAFKGSELFDLRYSGISRQIYRLSALCGDPRFVLMSVLETIAKERIQLGGDEWLQIATSLCNHATPSVALEVFEDLLASSSAQIGDEIGEGQYRSDFAGATTEGDVLADIIWHLLGDDDAFVRWSAARSIKGMLDVDLVEDIERLLDRFDLAETGSLASEDYNFAYLNAQQWLLMGLTRAALHHADKLASLKPRLESLLKRSDLHVVNKLHLTRCLTQIEGGQQMSPELATLWNEVNTPPHGVAVRNDYPANKARVRDFDFDYEFNKHKVSDLARLFGISNNEACDSIAEEVIKRWPDATSMSDFPGTERYRPDDRFEMYREHIQRHALLHAATTLSKSHPVVRASYDSDKLNPWQEWLIEKDVSFKDGSWLADHKDWVPTQAREDLLGERRDNQETLVDRDTLLEKIGFLQGSKKGFQPIYGHWKSRDGVYVRFVSALTKQRGAVTQCTNLSKLPDHDLWLPMFASDGCVDRFHFNKKARPFSPLIWEPETYPIGIDEGDEWAAKYAIARPRLGKTISRKLGITNDDKSKLWHNRDGKVILENQVWGEWKPDPDVRNHRFQDGGAILWAENTALDAALESCNRSLVYHLSFSKYKSRHDYDDSSGVKEIYVGLKSSSKPTRFWHAKKASKAVD
ncbi:MAG: NACHT domain-containing protein [Alphaproteobacteria bacterium]|nr:NACHT domain-containing protein [Alphaproteobacteria bacterium]